LAGLGPGDLVELKPAVVQAQVPLVRAIGVLAAVAGEMCDVAFGQGGGHRGAGGGRAAQEPAAG
jgi:hypothetical protein